MFTYRDGAALVRDVHACQTPAGVVDKLSTVSYSQAPQNFHVLLIISVSVCCTAFLDSEVVRIAGDAGSVCQRVVVVVEASTAFGE